MNYENLHELINRYEQNLYIVNNDKNDEIFKWKAVRCFQDAWFSPDAAILPFHELFRRAKKESSVLVDNSSVSPSNGVVKLAEVAEEEVRHLFCDVLFAADNGDLTVRQNNMDAFIEGMEKLRQKYFPANWKYQQDRHAASCYLAMYAPAENFIYKYSHVEAFAQHVEYGKDIGSGGSFSLAHYYELANLVVEALREHQELIDNHTALLGPEHYRDDSLHLLAFDIIYCASTYGFFRNLAHKSKAEAIKGYKEEQKRQAEEAKRQAAIDVLDESILKLEMELDTYRSISLVGIQVYQKKEGYGIIIRQDVNVIDVQFDSGKKTYIISTKFPMRPTFEDDAEIVAAMTAYEDKVKELKRLRDQRNKM